MAGVLAQTNASLLEVTKAAPLSDSFVSDSFGSGEEPGQGGGHGQGHGHGYGHGHGPHTEVLWEGRIGVWIPPIENTRESSTDGRDEITTRLVYLPNICRLSIGDCLKLEIWDGDEVIWKVSGVRLIGEGVELAASQTYELQIEVV